MALNTLSKCIEENNAFVELLNEILIEKEIETANIEENSVQSM